jgi:hypothetical protein
MPHYERPNLPALDELLTPPAQSPDPPAAAPRVEQGFGFVLTVTNLFVTAIIISGMLIDGQSVTVAMVTGAAYFFPTTIVYVLALTGTFTDVIRGGQRERTERLRIDAYADLAAHALTWRMAVEDNRRAELAASATPSDLQRRLATVEYELLQRNLPAQDAAPTYVPPYDNRQRGAFAAETQPARDTTSAEALAWAMALYGDDGLPDPRQVQLSGDESSRGRLRVPAIGSKRGPGSADALRWLLQKRVLVKLAGGYALNVALFPRREELRYVE